MEVPGRRGGLRAGRRLRRPVAGESVGGQSRPFARLRARYLDFAEHEAKGASPLYEELAREVARSEAILRFVSSLPDAKQQPNLVFAAVRHLCGTPEDARHLSRLIAAHAEPIRRLILARSTQTNEPGRCATLLPVLARLPQPLALLEVGASAGLCLLPDRYAYDYGRARLEPRSPGALPPPVFPCRASDATPIPGEMPRVVWRAGIDLSPVDLADPEAAAWLETLVWPGQEARAGRLRMAMRIAREDPPAVVRGDLVDDLGALAAAAPPDATLVIFHSAVLLYVAEEDRRRFARRVAELGAVWISNESPGVLPEIAAKLCREPPEDRFLLAVDGEPVAVTGPHGQSIDWLR
ncbi:MAG TPA: DUF2332 domain-containing protein [Longimicrobiaceae bacterium]|nr:DUF2332 domain-containing protein [Longimicrobiaceae bacterium]